ncbi:ubiquitin carboxyl-terminal hydrolase 36 [Exaiptasia diaphana]|uniref:Ubiquitin carboxyl-terminal hydrolase n=1 Tax=Exaiptasia diaphana TaxID=2652724 RepID=A0A913XAI1_EXADI|nr:ubiquitin carboxyl-terminal hydrolase 36 [Exaiptasia diaphana]KXJ26546.1 Ubiquitin carboxyl-terminal hydrolase 36 [Exaiptasia diaphana]
MTTCEVMSSQTEQFCQDSNVIASKLANDLDAKLTSSSKQVLLQRIEFKAASKPDEQYERLKKKYKALNQNASLVNGKDKSHVHMNGTKQDDLPEPKLVLCNPDKISLRWSKMRRVGPGLSNLGNTCYLNSVIQVLTYTAPLVNFLSTQEHTRECRAVGFCMMCELQRHVLRSFNHHQNESIKPQAIIQKLRCIAKHLRFGHQEDAHEFLRYVIDGMQKSCLHGYEKLDKASKETTVIHRIFSGYYRSQVRCLMCHNTSSTYDPLMDIMLDIKQSPTIVRALQRLCKAELLDGDNLYYCLKCKKKVPAHKQVLIHRPPNVLTVQLKRFDSNHIFGGKITKSVEYAEYLDLRPFMTSKGGPVKYKLYGVLVHSGYSSNSGHYYCYIRSSNNMWYNMNDSVVRQVGLNAALSQQAYLLFYIKMADNISHQGGKGISSLSTKSAETAQPGQKNIKENDYGTAVSRSAQPKFPNTFSGPTTPSKPSPSIITTEQRPKLSFAIKSPTVFVKSKNENKVLQGEQSSKLNGKQVDNDKNSKKDQNKVECKTLNEKETTNSIDLKPPEPVKVSLPVKKDEKKSSPTKNVRPPQLFIPRSVQARSSVSETKSLDDKNVSKTTPVKATTPWKVTSQTSNNCFTYGPMSPPPKGTPLPQPSPSSVTSDGSSTSSKTAKTGDWAIKDKRIPTPGPILPERQHAGWTVSAKSEIEKSEDEESWVEAYDDASKKSKKKQKKDKRKDSKKYHKLDDEKEADGDEAKDEENNKQNSDKENKKKHKKKKKKKGKNKRDSDKEELLRGKSSDDESSKEKQNKRKKSSHKGESKRQRLVDYTSDDSSDCIDDQNNNRTENTKEMHKKNKPDVPVVVYDGDQRDKTSCKGTWDGSRDSSTVNKLLKGSSGVFGYGDNVTTWEGGHSLVNVEKNERKRERSRDSWDQELDKGKVKKVKDKSKQEKFSGTNLFQREHDRRSKKGLVDQASSHFTRRHSSSHSRTHSNRGYRRI